MVTVLFFLDSIFSLTDDVESNPEEATGQNGESQFYSSGSFELDILLLYRHKPDSIDSIQPITLSGFPYYPSPYPLLVYLLRSTLVEGILAKKVVCLFPLSVTR